MKYVALKFDIVLPFVLVNRTKLNLLLILNVLWTLDYDSQTEICGNNIEQFVTVILLLVAPWYFSKINSNQNKEKFIEILVIYHEVKKARIDEKVVNIKNVRRLHSREICRNCVCMKILKKVSISSKPVYFKLSEVRNTHKYF